MSTQSAPAAPSNLNLPNALTVVRIILVPVFLVLLLGGGGLRGGWENLDPGRVLWAFAVFVLAMVTDWVDGFLARRWNLITDFGKIADPIADKSLMAAALIGLALVGVLPWWVPVVILVREFGITVLRFVIIRWVVLPASRGGKLKTVLQTVALGMFLLLPPLADALPDLLTAWMYASWSVLIAAIIVTVVTGIEYCVKSASLVREAKAAGSA